MTLSPSIVADPAPAAEVVALDPRWLTSALRAGGHTATVVGTSETWRLENMATKIRFSVDYAEPVDLPASLCVKGIFNTKRLPEMSARVSGAEARFYRDIAPSSSVRVPRSLYSGIDPATGRGILLMEDVVSAGGHFFSALDEYPPQRAAESVRALAGLHAESWGGTGSAGLAWLSDRLSELAAHPLTSAAELGDLLAGERGAALAEGQRDPGRLHRSLTALIERGSASAPCVVHGDVHAGNVFDLDGISIIDWQLVQVNRWALDVAYHLGAVLTVADRRTHERELLREYLFALRAAGVDAPSWDEAWLAYRIHMAYGYYLWAATRYVDPIVVAEFVQRLGTAVADLETYEELGV
jgi:hypothetical protein